MPQVRIERGDALDLLKRERQRFSLCCTSPPYGTTINYAAAREGHADTPVRGDIDRTGAVKPEVFADWFLPIVAEIARLLLPGGVLAINLNGQGAATYPEEIVWRIPRETPLVLHERCCWVKANAIPTGHRGTHFIPEWEPIWVFRLGPTLAYFGRDDIRRPYSEATRRRAARRTLHRGQQGHHAGQAHPYVRGEKAEWVNPAGRDAPNVIWAAPEQSPRWPHPARYPEAIPAFFIHAFCPPGGWVLDPFVGSGTTAAVAAHLGRNAVGYDLNPHYAEMARTRAAASAQPMLPLGLAVPAAEPSRAAGD